MTMLPYRLYSTDEDARLAMLSNGGRIGDITVGLSLSSRADMKNVVEAAVHQAMRLALDVPSDAGSVEKGAHIERGRKCRTPEDDNDNGKGSGSTSSVGRTGKSRSGDRQLRRDRNQGADLAGAGYRDGSGSENSSGGYRNAYRSGSPTVRRTDEGGDRREAEPKDYSDIGGGQSEFEQSAYCPQPSATAHHRELEFSSSPDNFAGVVRVSEADGLEGQGCVSLVSSAGPDSDAEPESKTEPFGFVRPGCVVALDDVPYRADFEDIVEFFDNFSVTVANVLWWYTDAGKTSCKVRVNFDNPQDAERAVHVLRNTIISNSPIRLTRL